MLTRMTRKNAQAMTFTESTIPESISTDPDSSKRAGQARAVHISSFAPSGEAGLRRRTEENLR